MALVSKMVSDISGKEGVESDFTKLTIRQHPAIKDGKARALDVLPDEVANLKAADNLVVIEIGTNGDRRQVVMTHTEFKKLCDDSTVSTAAAARGRRPGFRPSAKADDDTTD